MGTTYEHTLDVAKHMIANNCDMDSIAKITSLSLEEIHTLKI